jgi:arginase family enzyme
LEDFLTPIDKSKVTRFLDLQENQLGKHVIANTGEVPQLDGVDLAILGVCEDRGAVQNEGCALGPDAIRRSLYALDKSDFPLKLVDLGNILPGAKVSDTYSALAEVLKDLVARNIVTIILGGSHDLTYGQYRGYAAAGKVINLTVIDESIDVYKKKDQIDAKSFLYDIFTESPNYLFNFSQLAYQSYFVAPRDIAILEKLNFDFYRLGEVRDKPEEIEPVMRDTTAVSMDISGIRQSDAPAVQNPTPNGLFGEEACKIARYAGISDKVSSFGLYELNPKFDDRGQTIHLAAQMIWYFIEGFYSRKQEFPVEADETYLQYAVQLDSYEHELRFLKSRKSGRWWMQIPRGDNGHAGHLLVPCSYADYQAACDNEIPERWLKAMAKLTEV